VVGLITDNDEPAYREEVRQQAMINDETIGRSENWQCGARTATSPSM
jgi:hypothetical protein